jgi:hypothetical protein
VFKVSAFAEVVLGMGRDQLALLIAALAQTLEDVADVEFRAVFGWKRWDMRDFEARLAEVVAYLDGRDTVRGEDVMPMTSVTSAVLCSAPEVELFVDFWQVDILRRSALGAYYDGPLGQSQSRDEEIEILERVLSSQKSLALPDGSPRGDLKRGPVVQMESGREEDIDGPAREWPLGLLRHTPIFKLSRLAEVTLGMRKAQLAVFANAITDIVEEVVDWDFPSVFPWTRWDLREFGMRLTEVLACLEELDSATEARTGQ